MSPKPGSTTRNRIRVDLNRRSNSRLRCKWGDPNRKEKRKKTAPKIRELVKNFLLKIPSTSGLAHIRAGLEPRFGNDLEAHLIWFRFFVLLAAPEWIAQTSYNKIGG